MLFNSFDFIVFFPIVVCLYFVLPKVLKNFWLLVASYYFYMYTMPEYVVFILFSTVTTFVSSIAIEKAKTQKDRQFALLTSIFLNLSVLFIFKYYDFFNANLSEFWGLFGVPNDPVRLNLILPIGISFYTFQSLGYAIDVYLKTVKREKNFFTYALFVSFFPQLVAGPIERSRNLLPQFKTYSTFDYKRVKDGLVQMGWGLFKKMVIADGTATLVTFVYSDVTNFTGLPLIIASVLFAFQIYCDFSGYSDIAVGSARVLGFDLMRNFKHPYFAKNITEFWQRWHISLSSWFQDYIFMPFVWTNPLKKFGYTKLPVIPAIALVFLTSGLWHGAKWTFIFWGILNGFFCIMDKLLKPRISALQKKYFVNPKGLTANICGVIVTFLMVDFTLIFFRADSFSDAIYIINNLFNGLDVQLASTDALITVLTEVGLFDPVVLASSLCIIFLLAIELWERNSQIHIKLANSNFVFRWVFYYFIITIILFYGNFGLSPFVYFNF